MFKSAYELLAFLIGFIIGIIIVCLLLGNYINLQKNVAHQKHTFREKYTEAEISTVDKYNQKLSDKLFEEIKILCWVATMPANHNKKAIHVKNTWGKRCNKLLFISSQEDETIGAIALPVKESRNTLWQKTKLAFKYVYENYFHEYDWFIKADDDSYLVMENVRYLLYQFHPQTSLYIGNKYAISGALDGYMAGGGYILSKKALEKFVTKILPNPRICRADNGGSEDLEMGKCLQHDALIIDGRDDLRQQRFFPIGTEYPMKKSRKKTTWYENYEWFNVTRGSINCCSDTIAQMHYIKPTEMHFLEYLIYHLHPFGIHKNLTETIPAKLTLQQVIEAADEESSAPNYKKHKISHNIDVDERYRRRK